MTDRKREEVQDKATIPETGDVEKLVLEKNMDVDGTHLLYKQIAKKGDKTSEKTLDYDYKRCSGCGICVALCPASALELGNIIEISTGLDAPPVMLDLEKCTFCGMCANFCPIRAVNLDEDGKSSRDDPDYPTLKADVRTNDKCLPCSLCRETCPEEAIEVHYTFPKKEEVAPFKEGEKGEIKIDMERCNFCGICVEFCDAFILIEKEQKANDIAPFGSIVVDEDKCDYCVHCVDLCPEDAISVVGTKIGETPKVTGDVTIDADKCTLCGWCVDICPYDAMDMQAPFVGTIALDAKKLEECDPTGCHGCFNVCPSHAWYVPKDGDPKTETVVKKVAVKEGFCTYCKACEHACHLKGINVGRKSVSHTPIPEKPWAVEWEWAIDSITTGHRQHPDVSRTIASVEPEAKEAQAPEAVIEVDEDMQKMVREKIESMQPLLNDTKLRFDWEREKRRGVLKKVQKAKD